jgi:glycosyltransferase involved in cell wall biosynthesis
VKIAIIAPLVSAIREPQAGGSQAFVADLARGLASRGHGVEVYAASGSQIPGIGVRDTGVDPRSLAATRYRAGRPVNPDTDAAAAAFGGVYAAVRQGSYDVIHNHAFDAPAIRLAAGLSAPVAHTLHLPPDPAIAAALSQAALTGPPPAVIGVSAAHAAGWRPYVQVDAVIPPYVPTHLIPWSAEPGEGAVYAGRLSPEKGAAEAIDIAAAAGLRIDVYGDSYDTRYASEQIGPREHAPGVRVHPGVPRAQLWRQMARAAVVLCPASWDEPFGMAAAEAQACGTAVVAFRRGGLTEIIDDGVTGFLTEPGGIQAAADRARDAAGLSRRACRRHAEHHLDLRRSLDAHEQFYRRLAAGQVRTPAGG